MAFSHDAADPLCPQHVAELSGPRCSKCKCTELQIFHPTLKPNPTQNDVWAQAQISFNQDRATFLQDMGGSLVGIKSVFYENALQVPHSSKNYMLMQSHPSLNATQYL